MFPWSLCNGRDGMPTDEVAACLAVDAPELGIHREDDFYQYCHKVWSERGPRRLGSR